MFAYLYNAQGDVVGLANASGQQVVAYTYDAWGNILTQTDTSGRNLAKLNPFRYRGYVYDEETGLYYLQSRYYDPGVGRFINGDSTGTLASSGHSLTNNLYAYCWNNPVIWADSDGRFPDVIIDVLSIICSVIDVVINPKDPWAWGGLIIDVVTLFIPVVAGGGIVVKILTKGDDVVDLAKAADMVDDTADIAKMATTGSPNSIGKIGEELAGIDPSAKVPIEVNGRTRIPDALDDDVLTEVKNVQYVSNTLQLRDFADYANATGRKYVLYVRPTTRVSKNVIRAGWKIEQLW